MAKQYSRSQQIGDEGHTFAARIVTALGQTWHDRRVDHGIDGEIELINPATRQPLNRLVLVQSKASNSPFPGETDAGFHFLISNDDIAYWTNGTNPVIVVCSHPLADEIWWAPATRASPPGPGGKSWKIEFDKSADRLDRNAVPALLTLDRRWETRPSPVSIQRSERLVTNLLALVETPPSIYVAPTWLTDVRQLGPELRKRGYHRSDWLLRDRTIFSFTDPKSSALGSFVEGGIETIDAEEWSESKDTETTNRFVDLLRQTLREQEHQSLAVHGKQRYFYFRATRDLSDRRVATNSKSKGRTVFTGYENKRKPGEIAEYRHYAVGISFVRTDEGWAAQLTPTYHYTFDGHRELPWAADRLSGMKQLERNPAVSGLVRFWARYLGRPSSLGEEQRPLVFGDLYHLDVDRGIDEATWRPLGTTSGTVDSGQLELL
ncbi:MAG: DUF4365 domain-containing protein [Nocardioides sp.]|jgi:hypothetical protein